ncbi:hypothetical protein AGMMS49556_07480 [Endomicrobiia bacterium]|nr:hypothetical protein AGMMS49556_07480 [Endomicrobiia bacterium]
MTFELAFDFYSSYFKFFKEYSKPSAFGNGNKTIIILTLMTQPYVKNLDNNKNKTNLDAKM